MTHPYLFRESNKVGREEKGLSSNRPELVALRECLEAHDDHIDLLFLTDSEATLQSIHKWIDGGSKLNLSRSPDADVLETIILKLQKRVEAGATTLLIKVKTYRGDPLNEETDIRAKHGGVTVLKTSVWTNTVRNYIR